MELAIEDVKRLNVQPGETLVATVPDHWTMAAVDAAKRKLERALPVDVTVLVVPKDIELTVVAAPPPAPAAARTKSDYQPVVAGG